MANIVWPSDLCPRTFSLQFVPDVRRFTAPFGGSSIITDLADDSWTAMFEVDSRSGATAAKLESLVNYLQGGIHTCEFGHIARPLPRGILPATALLNSSASKGASVVLVNAGVGTTVKDGDFFEVGGLLLQASGDASDISGILTIPIVNSLRYSITSGTVVTFNSPKIKWRLSNASSVSNLVGYSAPVSLSFIEDI